MAALTASLCLLLALLTTSPTATRAQLDHEPVEHLKAHLPKRGDDISGKLEVFLQAPPRELKRNAAKMETNLRKVLENDDHVSAFLVRGSNVLARRTVGGVQFNSTFLLPHAILLPILSTTLPILLEGFKPQLLTNPMGEVLKGKTRQHSNVRDYLSLSLHDLVTKLPREGNSVDLNLPNLLSELNKRGKAAFFYLNTVLETVAEDAWRDALISVAMDHSVFGDNQQMLTHLKDLARYVEAVGSDIVNFYEVSKSDLLPLDGGHFLFGWWFNCPRTSSKGGGREGRCLAPFLPSNTMAILHHTVRVYTVPRLNLHLLVANSDNSAAAPRTLADVLEQDRMIWSALYSVVDPSPVAEKQGDAGEGEKKGDSLKDEDLTQETPTEPPETAGESETPMTQETVPPTEPESDVPPSAEPDVPPSAEPDVPPSAEPDVPPSSEPEVPPSVEPTTVPPSEDEVARKETEPPTQETQPEPDVPQSSDPEMPEAEIPPSVEPEDKKARDPQPPTVPEDEVVGDSMPKKVTHPSASANSSSSAGQPASAPVGREEQEDEVVEETREKAKENEKQAKEATKEKEPTKDTKEKQDTKEESLLIRAIYLGWPCAVFAFYTFLSHVWLYWLLHVMWLVCNSVFSGVYLPRPKTAKQD